MPTGDQNTGYADLVAQQAKDKAYNASVTSADNMVADATSNDADLRMLLEEKIAGKTAKNDALHSNAVADMEADLKASKRAGKLALKQPIAAPTLSGSLAPLQDITGVAVNSDLAGGNNATASYYVSPENTISGRNIGSPASAGNLGPRNNPSTLPQAKNSPNVSGGRKDQF